VITVEEADVLVEKLTKLLRRLGRIAPDDLVGVEVLIADQLRHRTNQQHDSILRDWLRKPTEH
jgi:hypothetical protein